LTNDSPDRQSYIVTFKKTFLTYEEYYYETAYENPTHLAILQVQEYSVVWFQLTLKKERASKNDKGIIGVRPAGLLRQLSSKVVTLRKEVLVAALSLGMGFEVADCLL
jgi:hypothetical protein